MKPNTEYHYRFENIGTPDDLTTGKANMMGITKALFVWLTKVSMNKNLKITIERNPFEGADQSQVDELEAFFAQMNQGG